MRQRSSSADRYPSLLVQRDASSLAPQISSRLTTYPLQKSNAWIPITTLEVDTTYLQRVQHLTHRVIT
jgi:hypothetical protein